MSNLRVYRGLDSTDFIALLQIILIPVGCGGKPNHSQRII
jgi:hypothetical protein